MRFQLLGRLRVEADVGQFEIRPGMPRRVLAVLLVRARATVLQQELIDTLWPDDPPANAVKALQTYVHRLRTDLGAGHGIYRDSGGYRLDVHPSNVDVNIFIEEVRRGGEARQTGDLDRGVQLLDQALRRWRGRPFDGLGTGPVLEPEIARLDQWHTRAIQDRADLHLLCGNVDEAIADLHALLAERPHQEHPAAQLMLALARVGRRVEALEVYQRHRRELAEEFGLEPGQEISRMHTDILRDDLPTADSIQLAMPRGIGPTPPRQLPPDLTGFVGRDDYLRHMDQLVAAANQATTSRIIVVSGPAGSGKTTLAVHWAHHAAAGFPDGQLYVNLRGFDASGTPLSPSEAIRVFLDALGVRPDRIPGDLDAQIGLYRSLGADRRILLVLDNACNAEQVRSLLPASPGCVTVVTSRNHLTGLIASEAAYPLALDLFTSDEARQLLVKRLGADRLADEPHTVDEIIRLTGRLPLAVAIVAARTATQPAASMGTLAAQLREQHVKLNTLALDDPAMDVRKVFSWSYHALGPESAKLFRLLGMHPGTDVTACAAASLAGISPEQANKLLLELSRLHLLTESALGRHSLHDLLQEYALELTHIQDSDGQRRTAMHRLLDHYLHTAYAAVELLQPGREMPIPAAPHVVGVSMLKFADHDQALRWFISEHPVLITAIEQAADHGLDSYTWQLAATLVPFFMRRGHWHEWIRSHRTALAAARRLDNQEGQARMHRGLGRAFFRIGRYQDAAKHLRHALRHYGAVGDKAGQAHTHTGLGWVYERQGRHHEGLNHAQQALRIYKVARNEAGQAGSLISIGRHRLHLGDTKQALDLCRKALILHYRIGNRPGQADAWDSLGLAYHRCGDRRRATTCYSHAIDLYRDLGGSLDQAETLVRLSDSHLSAHDIDPARAALESALNIYDQLAHPETDKIRTRLRQITKGTLAMNETVPVPELGPGPFPGEPTSLPSMAEGSMP